MSNRFVGLLRGINVGGHHVIPMSVLTEIFLGAGCYDVRTYIQSGNVIFSAPPNVVEELPERVAESMTDVVGFAAPLILRSANQWHNTIWDNPYLEFGVEPKELHVLFLSDMPLPAFVETLDPFHSKPDTFAVCNQEIYLHLTDGVAGSKLTSTYFDARLNLISTSRNWQTVLRIGEMLLP